MITPRELNVALANRFQRWLKVQEYADNTNRYYAYSVSALCEFLGDVPATQVTHLDIRDFLASVAQRGVKRATIWRAMSGLRCFFDFLNMGGLINWSPPRFVRLRRLHRPPPRVLTEKQIRAVLSSTRDLRERTMVEVFYGTGARAGELRSMRVEDVDLTARRIRAHGKCGYRYILFPRATTSYLRRYIGRRKCGYLFVPQSPRRKLHLMPTKHGAWRSYYYKYDPTRRRSLRVHWYLRKGHGFTYAQALQRLKKVIPKTKRDLPIGEQPMGSVTIRWVVMRIGLRVGLRLNPQLLRHTFATHLLDHGADIRMIQKMLGHINVGTTQAYTHVSMKHVQKVLEKCHPRNL